MIPLFCQPYLFYREEHRNPFTFAGVARPLEVLDTTPVKIRWCFQSSSGMLKADIGSSAVRRLDEMGCRKYWSHDFSTVCAEARMQIHLIAP